jgi:hypothetical protein
LRAFYYLQTLLTGDNETGRNPARFHTRRPLATIKFLKKSSMRKLSTIILTIFILSCSNESENLKNLKLFVDSLNESYTIMLDTMFSDDFKFISDSTSLSKSEYLDKFNNQDTTLAVTLISSEESDNIIKTKEEITNYAYQTLELVPLIREREYHFNEQNQIKAIYSIKLISEPVHEKFDKYFGLWSTIYYPEMYDNIQVKRQNGENFFEERHFLLIKLKEDGLDMLDSAVLIYNAYLEKEQLNENLLAIPLNEYVFEKILATVMTLLPSDYSEESPMSPREYKSILEKAFNKNGFSYSKTISEIAEYGFTISELQYVEIVLMPVMKIESETELANVYSGKELENVKKIIRIMNTY